MSTITPKLHSLSTMELNIEFLQIACQWPLFIGYRRPKSSLNRFSLGNVQTVAEGVRTDNCAIRFPFTEILSSIKPRPDGVTLASGRVVLLLHAISIIRTKRLDSVD
jgi:hypothetical protein